MPPGGEGVNGEGAPLARQCSQLLAETLSKLNLGEIADMLGFAHLSGFSRWFHGEFGMSPRQWRLKQNKAHP